MPVPKLWFDKIVEQESSFDQQPGYRVTVFYPDQNEIGESVATWVPKDIYLSWKKRAFETCGLSFEKWKAYWLGYMQSKGDV